MAKANSYNSGMRILKTLEYLHNLPEPQPGQTSVPVKPSQLADYLTETCGETTRTTARNILDAIKDSETGYMLDYSMSKGGQVQYHFRRVFTLEQISLLSTVISSSIFLNESEISTLLTQLKTLTSEENADKLSESEHFLRPRMLNPESLNNLRIIHEAIHHKQAICFYNGDITITKHIYYDKPIRGKTNLLQRITYTDDGIERTEVEKRHPNHGQPIICFPYALAWDNSRCYLIGGITNMNSVYSYTQTDDPNQKHNTVYLWNFRVDRMFELKITTKETYRTPLSTVYYEPDKAPEQNTPISQLFQVEQYMHSVFKMFTSTEPPVPVTLRFRHSLTRVIVERFGFDVNIIPEDNEYAHVTVNVQISQQFYGWLAGFYPHVLKLVAPDDEVKKYKEHLNKIVNSYSLEE